MTADSISAKLKEKSYPFKNTEQSDITGIRGSKMQVGDVLSFWYQFGGKRQELRKILLLIFEKRYIMKGFPLGTERQLERFYIA